MQPVRVRKTWFVIALFALAVIGVCGGIALFMPETRPGNSGNAALLEARSRWEARPFKDYYLEVEDQRCMQIYNVRDEHVEILDPQATRCNTFPRTISELFDLIERDNTLSTACVSEGCACDDILYVTAQFDQTLGYPRNILVRIAARPNWHHPDYWDLLFAEQRIPDCTKLAEGSKYIFVMKLKPIP